MMKSLIRPNLVLRFNRKLLDCQSFRSPLLPLHFSKSFHSSELYFDYYRKPKNHLISDGLLSRVWSRVPDGVKLITGVGIFNYLTLFVALPILTLTLPPIIVGSIVLLRVNKWFRSREMKKRWDIIEDSTLIFKPNIRNNLVLPPQDQINSEIANFEINRIIDAFLENEDYIADYFKMDINDLALGSIEAIQYDYNSMASVFADDYEMMIIQQRSLYNKSINKEIGTVTMSLKLIEKPRFDIGVNPILNVGKSKVLIEIKSNKFLDNKKFYLKTSSISSGNDEEEVITLKGKTKTLYN